jgi:acetyl esterase/lipase
MVTQQRTSTVPRYDPAGQYEVRSRDVEYRRDGADSWLARIYEPQGMGPFPALLEIHGGAWNNNDRTQNASIDEALAASGLVVVAIDFHLGTQAPHPAAQQDINYATRWLKVRAADFNASSEAVGGLGLSSGGHQIMLSAMRPRDPSYAALPLEEAPDVDAGLAYVMMGWPVLDPYARYLHARERGRQNLVASSERYFLDEAGMQEANPQLILERGEPVELPPALLLHGADDDVLAPRTAERFAEAYGRAGGVIELAEYPRAGHGFARESGPNAARALELMKSFVARQLVAVAAGW